MKLKDVTSLSAEDTGRLFDEAKPFAELMMQYRCAMLEVKTKLDVLNNELSLQNELCIERFINECRIQYSFFLDADYFCCFFLWGI